MSRSLLEVVRYQIVVLGNIPVREQLPADTEFDIADVIVDLRRALDKHEHERKPEAVDMLAVWEHYLDLPTEIDKIPERDALSRRQYVVDHLTAYCDKWWRYVHTFFSYEDSYSWEFLPAFLGSLPTHDVRKITPEQLTAALCAVVDSDSFRRFEKAKEQGL